MTLRKLKMKKLARKPLTKTKKIVKPQIRRIEKTKSKRVAPKKPQQRATRSSLV